MKVKNIWQSVRLKSSGIKNLKLINKFKHHKNQSEFAGRKKHHTIILINQTKNNNDNYYKQTNKYSHKDSMIDNKTALCKGWFASAWYIHFFSYTSILILWRILHPCERHA